MVLKRVILTGATGMFGQHMLSALNSVGAGVIKTSRSGKKGSIKWDLAHWLNNKELDEKFGDASAIIHCGALVQPGELPANKSDIFDVNTRSCANLSEWAIHRSVPLIFISSSSVYLDPYAELITDDAARGPNQLGGFYGITKILAEDVLNTYKSNGLRVAILRPSSLYGYGARTPNIVQNFLNSAQKDTVLNIYEPIADSIDFLHAIDLCSAVLRVLKTECWNTFNISSGKQTTIGELAEACVKIAGRGKVNILKEKSEKYYRKNVRTYALDNHMAQSKLGWAPKIDIKRGLELLYLETTEYPKNSSVKIEMGQ